MNSQISQTVSICVVAFVLLTMVGCGTDGLAPVSGTITYNGEPLESVLVVFTPQVVDGNHFPGPWSTGTTDSNGKYTLKTKKGSRGAVVGPHQVGFTWADISSIEISLLQSDLAAASMAEDPQAARAEIENKIRETKAKMEGRPKLDMLDNRSFDVTSGGSSTVDFDLGKKK